MRHLPNHHVLRIADERRRRADVARNCQRDQKRDGVEAFVEQRGSDDGRKNVADDVVVQKRGEAAGDQHQHEQKPRGISQPGGNAIGHPVVKSGQAQLSGKNEEAKQQKNCRPIDEGNDFAGADAAKGHHGNGAEQDNAHAIEFQPRHVPHGNAQIGDRKNRQNGGLFGKPGWNIGKQAGHGSFLFGERFADCL